ncbi:diguanylate cyclase domain-containing protein [Massilia rhizosphaerae]|uniref:diguanylate cyclase domain-containing protein n=1 Tax=Massilia rhizosphaerae TaxID=2784389 RepID=UPI0018DC47A6|nr:diguanylate cyclase [Massilia rhizosphaerae]
MLSQQDLAEEARIQALHASGLLDTPGEDRFDRFIRLAVAAFRVPIALLSLIDRERQWFKSRVGLEHEEIPRSLAICSHAIALDDMLVVPDTLQDERFTDHPHVTGAPGIRFYAGQPLHSLDGQPLGTLCIIDTVPRTFGDADRRLLRDLARLAEDELNRGALIESGEWLRTIADNVPALIAYVDTDLRYRFANERYREWFGVKSQDMIGKTVLESMGEAFYASRREALERCLAGHASHLEIEEVRRGHMRVVSSTYLPHVRDGVVQGIYVLSTDATAAREYERQLHALAHSDHLTGLPNRRSHEERLAQAIARARRNATPLALAYLDIDHFKQINDSLGHATGDAVLREFAQRLAATVRSTDTVARLAGDEFVIVLEQVGSPLECDRIAAKLHDAIRPPFELDGRTIRVTSSIGIAWSAHPDPSALAHVADEALYRSKHAGRDTATVFVVGA